ncbi:MAG: Eco57I restriction-modification methylase domain-containing protein [Bacteroidales bacterium]|nr:Eco57I restriction-modification methylase domain-containing protein [Bacteroidales bacterium]
MESIENKRKEMQDYLDAQKSQKDRNKMGQFSTPYPLALDIMRYMRKIVGIHNASFLEPAIGTGVFYSAFRETFNINNKVLGFEIDPLYYNPTKKFWENTNLNIRCANFLTQHPDEKFDMIVSNPPYIRHHHLTNESKTWLQNQVQQKFNIKISGLAGLYCYFMILASEWLKDGAYSCWLVPSEFMDVNYGVAVKKYLTENVQLIQIHRFNAEDLQFTDALVSSCIVVLRNNKPTKNHEVELTIGGEITNPEKIKKIKISDIKPEDKWTNLFTENEIDISSQNVLGDFFTVKRGIATGDNSFFIINEETITRYNIPKQFLRPIIPSPRYIKGNLINNIEGLPTVEKREFLFSCNLPENILKEQYPKVWDYVKIGYERGVNNGYICSRRKPWYSCEQREPATIIVPYMGRSDKKNKSFRFILNTSKAITTNVYLLLYPKPQYAECLNNEKTLAEVWRELNDIPTEKVTRNGRIYGGGLRKMEPSELMRTPADCIAPLIVSRTSNKQLTLFE